MKIEVYYTGGGIWLSEGVLDNGTFATVNSEQPELLTVYTDDEFLPEDVIFSKRNHELDGEHKAIYNSLLLRLKQETPQI